jgi:hypothetical protein
LGVSAEEAQAGLDAARDFMQGGYAGRSPGVGVIHEWPDRNDEYEFLVAVTDGTRNAAVIAKLGGSQRAVVEARGDGRRLGFRSLRR